MSYYWHARREPLPPGTKVSRDVVRRVWGFARDFRWQITGYLLLLGLSSLAAVVPALLVRELLNTAIPQRSFGLVNLIGLAAVGVALANAGLALGQRFLSSRIGEGLIYQLRTSLFDHVQRQPLAFFTHTQTGALTSRLNSDVVGAQRALTGTLGSVFSNLISLVTTLVTMFLLNWRITLIAVAVLPLFLLPARRVGRRLQAITRESMQLNAAMNTTMNERFNVAGALLVMLFGRRDRELAEFAGKAAGVRDIGVRSALYGQTFFVVLGLVGVAWPLTRRVESRPSGLWVSLGVLAVGAAGFTVGRAVVDVPLGPSALVVAIALNALAAVAEEAFFRRYLFGVLAASHGLTVAVVATAAAFALVHVTVWGWWVLPLDLAAGLVLSWQRAATGRWSVPAATHVLANTLALL